LMAQGLKYSTVRSLKHGAQGLKCSTVRSLKHGWKNDGDLMANSSWVLRQNTA
jgi:hypothetical protein